MSKKELKSRTKNQKEPQIQGGPPPKKRRTRKSRIFRDVRHQRSVLNDLNYEEEERVSLDQDETVSRDMVTSKVKQRKNRDRNRIMRTKKDDNGSTQKEDNVSQEIIRTGRTSFYRKRKHTNESMPATPTSYARCVLDMITYATDSQQKEMTRGIPSRETITKDLRQSLEAVETVKKSVNEIGKTPTDSHRNLLVPIARSAGKYQKVLGLSLRVHGK